MKENTGLREALEWYGEQARLARLIHSEGDAGRHALADDGGKRARAALSQEGGEDGGSAAGAAPLTPKKPLPSVLDAARRVALAIPKLIEEIDAMKHDNGRYVQIASDLATELENLKALKQEGGCPGDGAKEDDK
jgi:hypothetical protein